jgi:hypothetical protein
MHTIRAENRVLGPFIPRRLDATTTTTTFQKVCVVYSESVLVLLLLHYWLGSVSIFGGV